MVRLGPALVIAGILCYAAGLMVLHTGVSPLVAIHAADLMMACIVGGTFITLAGVVVWHRQRFRHHLS